MGMLRAINISQKIPQYAFADIVDEYGDSVYKFCRSLTYSKEDADDLFQETFLRALEQLPKAENSDNPQGFLFSSALYIWKSWKRRYARRKRLAPVEPLDETVHSGESVEDNFLDREENRIVRTLVEALPEKLKIPVILYYSVETSIPDIALSLKIPVGTVKSRLFKARKIIEKGLTKYEG
ncbi:ECF RNA polymerase sigma factor SigW [Clostridia bacterium]|nr:ECF RNA polymerase sigma factor SigW [Clostridia bacterium]